MRGVDVDPRPPAVLERRGLQEHEDVPRLQDSHLPPVPDHGDALDPAWAGGAVQHEHVARCQDAAHDPQRAPWTSATRLPPGVLSM